MKPIRMIAAALILVLSSITTFAMASSYSTDQSDLWWTDPPGSENGWGFQLVQRNSVIFAMIFVYGPTSAPTWYTATMTPNPPGSVTWSGVLYLTFGTMVRDSAVQPDAVNGAPGWNDDVERDVSRNRNALLQC